MFKRTLLVITFLTPLFSYAYEYETIERPRQECWSEPTSYRSTDGVGAIIGGIAGGIIGHQVGGGAGRVAATMLGAGTGAIVGDRLSSDRYYGGSVERCRTVVERVRLPVRTREVVYEDREIVQPYYASPVSSIEYVEQVGYYPGYRDGYNYGGHSRHHHHHHHHHHHRH